MSVKPSRARHEAFSCHKTSTDNESTESVGYLGIQLILSLACLIGVWGIVCLISGLTSSEGFYGLGASWISAVIGI